MTDKTPITDEWLSLVNFKWRQFEQQPNKRWTLKLITFQQGSQNYDSAAIEVQRSGWHSASGYVGDPDLWMLWFRDMFDRTAYLGEIRWQSDITALAEIIMGHPWNPKNHRSGQAWPPK